MPLAFGVREKGVSRAHLISNLFGPYGGPTQRHQNRGPPQTGLLIQKTLYDLGTLQYHQSEGVMYLGSCKILLSTLEPHILSPANP